ncbi:MAG: cobalamin-binding protein [Halobacteriota archaeon]
MSEKRSADPPTRVVSLAPSATATLRAVGAGDRLVGVSTHCDAPSDLPRLGGWVTPAFDRVDALDPDLVCTSDDLQAPVRDELRDRGHRVCHTAPTTLEAVFESFETLGRAVGCADEGAALCESSRERVQVLRDRHAPVERPTVYCEEWSDPPMAAGNWVPEVVEVAGGSYPFVDPGERSRAVNASTVSAEAPDHVVLNICGRGDRVDPAVVTDRDWDLDAEVHVVDDSLLNQPSPNLLDGIEAVAEAIHG